MPLAPGSDKDTISENIREMGKTHPHDQAVAAAIENARKSDIEIADAEFKESDHPRAEDGKFGSGGGKSKSKFITKIKPLEPLPKGVENIRTDFIIRDENGSEQLGRVSFKEVSENPEYKGKELALATSYRKKDGPGWIDWNERPVGKIGEVDQDDYYNVRDILHGSAPDTQLKESEKADAFDMPLAQNPAPDGSPQMIEPFSGLDDLSIAEKMASGEIDQIVATDKCLLVPMRITGTGITERTMKDANGITIKYPIDRPADVFLSDRFLQMCNGLPVAFYHPQDGEGFTSLNFSNWKDYVVGAIFYPFIKGTEVWGVAKIFDLSMLDAFRDGIVSTSPFVTSENVPGDGVYVEKLEDINHVAIVPAGHWDTDQPAITANKEIQMKEDLMADKENPVAEAEKKADADVTQVNPAETVKKPDAEVPQALAGDDQPAEDARFGKLEAAVASLTEGMAAIKSSIDALVASDKEVHENIDADPVMGEEEERKATAVNALTEMADSQHADVKIVKPVSLKGESTPEWKRRVIAHNIALVDPAYAGLAKTKADSAIEPLLDKAIESIGVNAKKKSDELYRSASTVKGARIPVKPGVERVEDWR